MNKVYALLACTLILLGCNSKNSGYFTRDGITQGTTYHIVFQLTEDAVSSGLTYNAVCDSIDLYLKDIDFAVSGYNKASILSLFNNNPDSLYTILNNPQLQTDERNWNRQYKIFMFNYYLAGFAYKHSEGLVDCSAAPLFDLWGFGFKEGVDVTQSQIDSVKKFIGMENFTESYTSSEDALEVTENETVINKKDPRCRLNFNAIAQGVTADYIGIHFMALGIKNFLVEIGGEVFVQGVNPQGQKWRIGIDKPVDGNNAPGEKVQEVVELTDGGLVTSGDYRKFYIKDGHKISHTINPKTGYPAENNLLSATILSSSSAMADFYATYCMVLGLEGAQEFVQKDSTISGAILIYSVPKGSGEAENDSLAVWKYDKRIAE